MPSRASSPLGEPCVVVNDEGTFLAATLDDLFTDAGRLGEAANEHLARLNGYAMLADAGYQKVRLRNKFLLLAEPNQPRHVHVMAEDEARGRDRLTVVTPPAAEVREAAFSATILVGGKPVEPPPPEGPRQLARGDKNVDDLLALVGKAEKLSWSELYKIFEVVRDAVGGGREGLCAMGWTIEEELSAFTFRTVRAAGSNVAD